MKKNLYLFVLAFFLAMAVHAQPSPQIILHLQSADTLVHRALVNQVNNLKKEFPNAAIDIICHGPGIDFLKNKSVYAWRIYRQNHQHVTFTACEFTMAQRNIKRDELVSFARTVPYALAEIVRKQESGWRYIKLGF